MPIDPNNPHAGGEFHGFSDERKAQIEQKASESEIYMPPNSPSNPKNMNQPGFIPQSPAENERRRIQAELNKGVPAHVIAAKGNNSGGMQITHDAAVSPNQMPDLPLNVVPKQHAMTAQERIVAHNAQAKQPVTIQPIMNPNILHQAEKIGINALSDGVSQYPTTLQPHVQQPQTAQAVLPPVQFIPHTSTQGFSAMRQPEETTTANAMGYYSTKALPDTSPSIPHMGLPVSAQVSSLMQESMQTFDYVKVPEAPYIKSIASGEYVSLDLPSRFHFYDIADIYATPFGVRHLGKIAIAKQEKSMMTNVEIVSSVLKTSSGRENLAFDLTVPDFYFILYWLRQNSYTKYTFTHSDLCTSRRHVDMIDLGTKSIETLKVSEIINKTRLKTLMLDRAPDIKDFPLNNPNLVIRPALMRDVVEISMEPRMADADFAYMANPASYVTIYTQDQNGVRPMTVGEKVDYLYASGDSPEAMDDIQTLLAWAKALDWYGVQESITMRCKECGASWESKISLEVHSFLSAA